MFRKTDKPAQEITTLLGKDTRVTGDVEFAGGLHLDGTIVGNVMAAEEAGDGASLSVSEGGVVEGSVRAPEVVLNGTVKGDVTATRRVELGPTAKVVGNVVYHLIEMEIGAEVNGKLVHADSAAGAAAGGSAGPVADDRDETDDTAAPASELIR
jgi:cytoskeletal protein CcmA (bactofilin family)